MSKAGDVIFAESKVNCEANVMAETNTSERLETAQQDTPAFLLVGGLGTRLQSVLSSTPKPLARVGKMPFLELLVLQLRSQGIRRIVMCTGHLASQIEQEFGDGKKWGVAIDYSQESQPLGTAGAVKLAERYLKSGFRLPGDERRLISGTRFTPVAFNFIGSMAEWSVWRYAKFPMRRDTEPFIWTLTIASWAFSEKTGSAVPGIINGGVYVFNRAVLNQVPQGPASFEKDVFPRVLEQGVYALEQYGMFIDIGTPEDYARAQTICQSLYQAASPNS